MSYDPNPPINDSEARSLKEYLINFLVINGKKPLILDYKTFVEFTRLDYAKGTYVSHPSPEAMKDKLAKIVLGWNYSSIEQINSIQQMIAYCLITMIKVDIREIIYSDLVTKFTSKSRQKYVSYPRFISYALEVLLGSNYTQDETFESSPIILSNSNFSKDPSKVTEIKLTAPMIAVNNQKDLVSPLPFSGKKKKVKSQTMTPTLPKSQGPKASRSLSKKSQKPKSKKTLTDTQVTPPIGLTEGYKQSHSVSSGNVPDPQDPERNIQFAGMGLPSTSLDEGIHKSQPLPESTTTDPKDSRGNVQPADKGLTSMSFDDGTVKTTPLPEGPRGDKDSEGLKPPADMEPLTNHVADPLGTGAKYQESDNEEVFAAEEEIDEDIPPTYEEFQSPPPNKEQPKPSHEKHEEAAVSYVDLRASIEGYYEENVDHRDQTHKLVQATDDIKEFHFYITIYPIEQVGLVGDLGLTNDILIPLEMDEPDITKEEYIQLEAKKARRRGQEFNWETATYGKVRYYEDINYFKDFENEFPAIVYEDALTFEPKDSSEPTVSAHHVENVDFDFVISFYESNDEDYTFTYDKNSFSYKLVSVNDLKLDSDNDDDKIDIKQSLGDIFVEQLANVISIDTQG
ncbi:hypothetical protein Tco_0445070 [Tanacetum coccineum]